MKLLIGFGFALFANQALALNCTPGGKDAFSFSVDEGVSGEIMSMTLSGPALDNPVKLDDSNGGQFFVDQEVSESQEKTVYLGSAQGVIVTVILPEPIPEGKSAHGTIFATVKNHIVEAQLVCTDESYKGSRKAR